MKRACTMLAMAFCLACQTEKTQAPIMKTDLQELSKLIQFPAAPVSAKWILSSPTTAGRIGPNDFTIVALLEFSAEGMQQVRAKSNAAPDAEPVALRDPELPLFFTAAEAVGWERPSHGFVVVPGTTFGPAAFAKAPYMQGKVVIVDGRPNLVLVTLYTT